MKPTVLVTSYYDARVTDPELERLEPMAKVRRVALGRCPTEPELIDLMPGTSAIVISADPFTERVFDAAPQLRMIVADGVGVNSVDLEAATRHGVIVNNAPFVQDANGEFTIGLILALLRRIVHTDRSVRGGRWNQREQFIGHDLSGQTLGLLGFGRAAQSVARRSAGFDLQRLAYCRNPDRDAAARLGVQLVGFDELLARSSILSLHTTLTDETRGMIAAPELARLRRGSILINTSRGAVVDEPALVSALQRGHLAAAAIDVFTTEPPPVDHPLLAMDNVIVTAHIASDSAEAFRAVFRGVVDDILLLLNKRRPAHIVNPAVLDHERCKKLRG